MMADKHLFLQLSSQLVDATESIVILMKLTILHSSTAATCSSHAAMPSFQLLALDNSYNTLHPVLSADDLRQERH